MESFLDKNLLIGIIITGSILILVLIGIFLFKFVFQKNKIKRHIRDIDRRFQYLHALLIGQDAQYVKRLEIISRTNLLYVEIHTKFLKRFKEIRDKHDGHAQNAVNNLKDLLEEKKYKQLKEAISDVADIISSFEKEVNSLNSDLLKVVKPEEDCRQSSLSLKEQLRRLKSDYYVKQADLTLLSESFEEVFKYVDSLFEEFEELVESAQYDDANAILPKIDQILHELTASMNELPNLCALVVTIIPEKFISLENAYEAMVSEHFPLHHLCVKSTIASMKLDVENLTSRIKRFDIRGVREKLENIVSEIDEFFTLFEEERKARGDFEQQNDEIYRTVNTIERRFIKLCNTIPEISKVYIINSDYQSKINNIQTEINKVGALKRSLDTFIHSSTKQPYSILVEKMTELSSASKSIISEIDEYNNYLNSLRETCEEAYSLVFDYFKVVKQAEQKVSNMHSQEINDKYMPEIDRFYDLLNETYKSLLVSPIDVEHVKECVTSLHEINNNLFDNGSINQDYNMKLLAENAILYANRDRSHLSDINQLVSQAEAFFAKGDFEQAYIIAGNALRKVKSENESR